MINPRKDNLHLCSSNDLYKRLFLTQPENALFLNDSVSLIFLSPFLPLSHPPPFSFSCLPSFLLTSLSLSPSFFLSSFLSLSSLLSSFLFLSLSLSCSVCVVCVCCVCVTVREQRQCSQSRWDSVFIAMPTCSKRRVHAQKRLSGGHGLAQPPNKWMETRKIFWKQND